MADITIPALPKATALTGVEEVVIDQAGVTKSAAVNLINSVAQRTGTAISFDRDAYYGTPAALETGNITANLTGAVLGVSGCILHNSGTVPTFGSGFVASSNSGTYATGVLNYIYYNYISATKIVYTISQ